MADPTCVFCKRLSDGDFYATDLRNVVMFEPLNPVTPTGQSPVGVVGDQTT